MGSIAFYISAFTYLKLIIIFHCELLRKYNKKRVQIYNDVKNNDFKYVHYEAKVDCFDPKIYMRVDFIKKKLSVKK